MGLGQIYFNLRGREGQGIVSPGAESARSPTSSSASSLTTLIDPETEQHIVRNVYKRDDVYSGEFLGNAPGPASRIRGRLPRLVADDARRRAAGHRLPEHEEVERRPLRLRLPDDVGHLHQQRPIAATDPRIIDIAPTVLKFFGVTIPATIDGKPILK